MPAAISTATTTPKAHALSSALPLGGNTIIRLVAIQIHITTPLSASRSRLTRKGDHHHASSITAKAVLAQAYARGYYNAIVQILSIDKIFQSAFQRGGRYALPPAVCPLGYYDIRPPTYRGGGHLLPSYNTIVPILSKAKLQPLAPLPKTGLWRKIWKRAEL